LVHPFGEDVRGEVVLFVVVVMGSKNMREKEMEEVDAY